MYSHKKMLSSKSISARYRPWLWPVRFFEKLITPVPCSLWLLNILVQRIFRLNGNIPWMVHYTSRVLGKVEIGQNVWQSFALSGACYIQGFNGIRIGDDTIFAPGVKIISSNHSVDDLHKQQDTDPIIIGQRCWIAANAVILPGVCLGDDVVVGAGAVVTKSFPSKAVIAGVPAKIVRMR